MLITIEPKFTDKSIVSAEVQTAMVEYYIELETPNWNIVPVLITSEMSSDKDNITSDITIIEEFDEISYWVTEQEVTLWVTENMWIIKDAIMKNEHFTFMEMWEEISVE